MATIYANDRTLKVRLMSGTSVDREGHDAMTVHSEDGVLTRWAARRGKVGPRRLATAPVGLRFAFYGRMSTMDYQHRISSQSWQHTCATDLVAEHGRIVVEYFDDGISRRVAWPDRPQAARLLQALADPTRGFDAIVVGEYERAFTGKQLEQLAPILLQHQVPL